MPLRRKRKLFRVVAVAREERRTPDLPSSPFELRSKLPIEWGAEEQDGIAFAQGQGRRRSHYRWALDKLTAGPYRPNTHVSPDTEGRAPPPPPSQGTRMMGSGMGAYGGALRPVESAAGETMLLWGLGQPESHRNNALVRQAAHAFELDACGRRLSLLQSPSSMATPGVTGAVVWDSGVVLAKFLEHSVDSQRLLLRGARAVDLGSGCGLVGCVAALLGAHVVLTDLADRLKLLRKNVALNVDDPHVPGSARVTELVWGDNPHHELLEEPLPDFGLLAFVFFFFFSFCVSCMDIQLLSASDSSS